MTSENIDIIKNQIQIYRNALQEARHIESDLSWIKLYETRLLNLTILVSYFTNNDTTQLNIILESEGRSYGWSFYPGIHGEKAENAFWKLKTLLTDTQKTCS